MQPKFPGRWLPMKCCVNGLLALLAATALLPAQNWYVGDSRCPPPKNDGTYAAPYKASDHPNEYPAFDGADKKGWSCSYQREDGVFVQFGDSRTPQEQWLSIRGDGKESD